MERLQKFIASCGVASRRKAEELITEGKVQVNGRRITELGVKIDPQKDKVKVNGQLLAQEKPVYYFLKRIAYAGLTLGGVKRGGSRQLTIREVKALKALGAGKE